MLTAESLPAWVPRLIAALLIAVLVLALVSLALVLPALPRMVEASGTLPTASTVVEGAPETLKQVERIDGNVAKVTPSVITAVDQIPALTEQLEKLLTLADTLHDDVGDLQESVEPLNSSAAELVTVAQQIEALRGTLIELLALGAPVRDLSEATGPILDQLRQLNESAATLASLVPTMESLDEHITNLDRKTGPVLLP